MTDATPNTATQEMSIDAFHATARAILDEVSTTIVGQETVVRQVLICIIAGGHALLEGVPGLGKTMLVRTLADVLDLKFARIQFTPDLMPADIVGTNIMEESEAGHRFFRFEQGPVFANLVLADEINRATPRAQAALLECMGERQVTVDGVTRPLPRPFLVLATQNPIEYEGTFPLPEAQLDRFLFKVSLGYLSAEQEGVMLQNLGQRHPIETLESVADGSSIPLLAEQVWQVHVDDSIRNYIVALTQATRTHPDLTLGASPRGALALYRGAQARAALRGRDYVLPDDVQALAPLALPHRCIVKPESALRGRTAPAIVTDLIEQTPLDLGDVHDR